MIQVATFTLPEQQGEANRFLQEHKPQGQIHFNTNMIVVFYDDGVFRDSFELEDWREYIYGAKKQRKDLEIALAVAESELDHLNFKKNKDRFENVSAAVRDLKANIANLDFKCAFVQSKIDELEGKRANHDKANPRVS